MNDQTTENNYSFCPKCGALMRNGVCPSCANKHDGGVYSAGNIQKNASNMPNMPRVQNNDQNPYLMPDGYVGKKKKGKAGLVIGIIAAVIFLIAMVIGCFFYGRLIGSLGEEFEDGDFLQDWDSIGGDRFGDDNDYGSAEEDDEYDDEEYVPSPDDEYYYGPCDAINEDVSYKIVPKTYDKSEADSDVIIQVNYYLLEGDSIPNVDKLNEAIEKVSLYYAEDFLSSTGVAEYGESYYAWVDSYVTYNDEDMISIVLDENIYLDGDSLVDLYCINIDLKNGLILDNTSMVNLDEAFAAELRRRSDEQNGHIDYLDQLSDKELLEKLRDKNAIISFFTPLGMEIGINYSEGQYGGWFTATYKDYEEYKDKF